MKKDKLAHVKTEFGFDVLEVAHGRYAPDSYHDFIGFGVSVPLLEQAFQETYGLDLKTVLTNEDEVLGSYRHAVSQLLPKATRIAWSLKKDEILKDQPSMTRKKFLYNLSRASYQKNWGKNYQPPTFWERFVAFLTRILPKVGPLRVLQLKTPTPAAEKLFQSSFNTTLDRYRQLLTQVGTGQLDLPNENFDTGAITGREYIGSTMRRMHSCWTRWRSRISVVLRWRFGLSFWNSLGIRMLLMRRSESQRTGQKYRPNLNNWRRQLPWFRLPRIVPSNQASRPSKRRVFCSVAADGT